MFLCIMNDDPKEMVTTLLPALTRSQQYVTAYLRQLLQILFVIILSHSDPRHSPYKLERADGHLDGCDVFSNFLSHRHSFYLATGEIPESLYRLTRTIRNLFLYETGRYHTLSPVSREKITCPWVWRRKKIYEFQNRENVIILIANYYFQPLSYVIWCCGTKSEKKVYFWHFLCIYSDFLWFCGRQRSVNIIQDGEGWQTRIIR